MKSVPGGSNMDDVFMSRATLIAYYKGCSNTESRYEDFLQKVKEALRQEILWTEIKQVLSKLISDYKAKMETGKYNVQQFYRKNKDWMQAYISFPVTVPTSSTRNRDSSGVDDDLRGRPQKDFAESSDRSKRRKTEELRKKYSPRKLIYAAQMEYRAKKQLVASKILKDITSHGAAAAEHYTKIQENHCQRQLAPEKALSLLLEANLIVAHTREANCSLFPSYENITETKAYCYPESISVTETCAEVSLQNLLDHTSKRLCLSLSEGLCLITKWGCDGSGCHSQYNQKFDCGDDDDSYIFITSIVPIRLVCDDEETARKFIVWQNPRPSSTRYCRPLRLQLTQETTEKSKQEALYVENQVNSLESTVTQINEKTFIIKHKLKMTMVDGKMVNAVTDTASAQRCYLCTSTTKDFFSKLGLHVDKPRPGGEPSTTENVARAILRNADVTAEVTGVDRNLIQRCHIILSVLSSGQEINTQEFKKYCLRTAAKLVFLYPWYSMPTTVHKVLLHGSEIIKTAETAIGLLSEDAQEARNKDRYIYKIDKDR